MSPYSTGQQGTARQAESEKTTMTTNTLIIDTDTLAVTATKETMDLINDWYACDEQNKQDNARIIRALRFIGESPYEEAEMIDLRARLQAALAECEHGSPSDEQRNLERQLLAAHADALCFISSESCDAIASAVDTVEAGDYLYEYDDGTDENASMPRTMGDDVADAHRKTLRARGLDWRTDDIGWLVYDLADDEEDA